MGTALSKSKVCPGCGKRRQPNAFRIRQPDGKYGPVQTNCRVCKEMMVREKVCEVCGESKTLCEFYYRTVRRAYENQCRACKYKKQQAFRSKNRNKPPIGHRMANNSKVIALMLKDSGLTREQVESWTASRIKQGS